MSLSGNKRDRSDNDDHEDTDAKKHKPVVVDKIENDVKEIIVDDLPSTEDDDVDMDNETIYTWSNIEKLLLTYCDKYSSSMCRCIVSMDELKQEQINMISTLNDYLQQDNAGFDAIILQLADSIHKVIPLTRNLCAQIVKKNPKKTWVYQITPTAKEREQFGALCDLHSFKLMKALSMSKNVDLELGVSGFLSLGRYALGPAFVDISADRAEPIKWNDMNTGDSGVGKFHVMALVGKVINNNEVLKMHILQELERWYSVQSPLMTSAMSFAKFAQLLFPTLGIGMPTLDEIGSYKGLFQLKTDRDGKFQQSEGLANLLNYWGVSSTSRKFCTQEFEAEIPCSWVNTFTTTQTKNASDFIKSCDQSGLSCRYLYWKGQFQKFKTDGHFLNGSNIDCVKTFQLHVLLQDFTLNLSAHTSIATMCEEVADSIKVQLSVRNEIYMNRLNKLICHFKSAQTGRGIDSDSMVASVVQKYGDLKTRVAGVLNMCEIYLDKLFKSKPINISALKDDLVNNIQTTYLLDDSKIINAAFCLVFGNCFNNYVDLTNTRIQHFSLTADQMKIEIIESMKQSSNSNNNSNNNNNNEDNSSNNDEENDVLLLEQENKQNMNNNSEESFNFDDDIIIPDSHLVHNKDNLISQFLLQHGKFINITGGTQKMTSLFNSILGKQKKPLKIMKSIGQYLYEFELGQLINTKFAGCNWMFIKAVPPNDINGLSDKQMTGLCSLGVSYNLYVQTCNEPTVILMKNKQMEANHLKDTEWKNNLLTFLTGSQHSHVEFTEEVTHVNEMKPRLMDLQYSKQWLLNFASKQSSLIQSIESEESKSLMEHFETFMINDKQYIDECVSVLNAQYTGKYAQLTLRSRISSGCFDSYITPLTNDHINKNFLKNKENRRFKLKKDFKPPVEVQQYLDAIANQKHKK